MPKQLVKVFTFEKDATAFEIENEINHWLYLSEVKIVDLIITQPGAFDRFVVYNIIYEKKE